MSHATLKKWHDYTDAPTPDGLRALLHADVVLHSPVVHTPQRGRDITFAYLWAANETLGNESFEYLREIVDGDVAVLEFRTVMNGITVNGIDMITWDEDGLITDFKVMVRPLQAVNKVHAMMGEMLAKMKAAS